MGGNLGVESSGSRRACPFCAAWNEAEFSFCQRCANPLPPPGDAERAPAAIPGPGLHTADEGIAAAGQTTPIGPSERDLNDEERAHLAGLLQSPAIKGTRMLGFLFALAPLAMILFAFLGLPFVPFNYMVVVVSTGGLGLALGGASLGWRKGPANALARGVARELNGRPVKRDLGAFSGTGVVLDGWVLLLPPAETAKFVEGEPTSVLLVETAAGTRGVGALMIRRGGRLLTPVVACFASPVPGGV